MNIINRIGLVITIMLPLLNANAQEGSTSYTFLNIGESAHSTALGGGNVSLADDDITLLYTNPALLSNVSDKSVNLDVTTYINSTNKFSAAFAKHVGERGTWAVGGQVLSYGSMTETDEMGTEMGSFSASDIALHGSYAYMLNDYWSGAVSAKMLITNYANYNAFAIGVDLGLNYYDDESGLSMSIVGRNLGGQLKALYEKHESMPFNLALGFSKKLGMAPLRLHATLDDLTHWHNVNFGQHIIIGADVLIGSNMWAGMGYNFRRSKEMKVAGSSHLAGFSLGAGINLKKLKLGVAWGKYHVSASSLVINVSYTL